MKIEFKNGKLFIEKIETVFYNVFDDIKSDKKNIYVYGAGALAMRVIHRLQEERVKIHGVVVDREFLIDNSFCDYPVGDFDSLADEDVEYSIVMGLSDYTRGIKKKELYPQISKVYCLVDVPYKNIMVRREDLIGNSGMYEMAMKAISDDESIDCLCSWIKCSISGRAEYCYPFAKIERTYFNNDIFYLSDNESMLDIGAYDGDTIKQFYEQCNGKYSYIYGIEGDKTNFEKLKRNMKQWGITERISLHNEICFRDERRVSFDTRMNEKDGYYINEGLVKDAKTVTLDSLLGIREKVTLIKMNFPDSLDVLKGAIEILKDDKPKLAIMAGWGSMLAVELILFIHEIVPEYRIYLRYASAMPSRIMLLATVDS